MHVQGSSSTSFSEESVQTLLFDPNTRSPLNQTPLHRAAQNGKDDQIQFLLKNGANIDAVDNSGRTALFLAVIQGHRDTVQLLINQGASLLGKDIHQETLLDIAIRNRQEEIAHLLLGTRKRLDKEKIQKSSDLDKFYEECLLKAKKEALVEEQIFYLIFLSESYLKRNNFAQAASILNSAFAILKKEKGPLHIEGYLLARLERIETFFLATCGISASPQGNKIVKYRDYLILLRNTCESGFTRGESSQVIVNSLTMGFKKLFQSLLREAMDKMGPPPVKWACMGMGSYARREMCPYSDVEFAFVIEKESPEALKYFRGLSKWLQLMIINLGETNFPIFGPNEPSPTPNGFCIDSGGNTPLGGVFEFIGTPQYLSQLQTSTWINNHIILANVMSCVGLIDGDESLVARYQTEVSHSHSIKENGAQANHQFLALQLLKGHLEEFAPNLTEEKEKLKAFGIKKELYRPIQEIINCLCLYYQGKAGNTFDRIDELVKIEVLSAQGAENLKNALRKALTLRLEAHFFYKEEKEILSHRDANQGDANQIQKEQILYIDEQKQQDLTEIYELLTPLHWMAENFYKTQNRDKTRSTDFSSAGLYFSGATLELLGHYDLASQFFQKQVSLNPNVDVLMKLASVESQLGKEDKALKHYQEALAQAISSYGKENLQVAKCYCNIGMLLANQVDDLGDILHYYTKALTIAINDGTPGGRHDAGCYYLTIGTTLKAMKQPKRARASADCAAVIYERLIGTEYGDSTNFNLVANLYLDLGDVQNALKYHQRAFDLSSQDDFISKGGAHFHLGECYEKLGDFDNAIIHLKKSIALYSKEGVELNKKEIASGYTTLGRIFEKQNQHQKALICHQEVIKIVRVLYGKEHYRVTEVLQAMGMALFEMGNFVNAIQCFTKMVEILKKLECEPLKLARALNNLAACYYNQKDYDACVKIYKKVITLKRSELSCEDPDLAETYQNMGAALLYLGKKREARTLLKNALDIYIKVYPEGHAKRVSCRHQMLFT